MEKRWISVKETADYLSIHYKSVYRLIDRGQIVAGRVGNNVRVDLKALTEKLERGFNIEE